MKGLLFVFSHYRPGDEATCLFWTRFLFFGGISTVPAGQWQLYSYVHKGCYIYIYICVCVYML